MRGLLSSSPTIQSHPCLLFLRVLLHGPCLPFFGQWQRPGAERFLCGDTPSVQAHGLSSAGGCSQPGWALIHSARDGLHSPLGEAWPSRRAGPVPGGRWPGGALRADSSRWASPGTEAQSTYVVALRRPSDPGLIACHPFLLLSEQVGQSQLWDICATSGVHLYPLTCRKGSGHSVSRILLRMTADHLWSGHPTLCHNGTSIHR